MENNMSVISGAIYIEFDTDKTITEEQFEKFKRKVEMMIESNWEMAIYDTANTCGFEADDMHPIMLDDLSCDYGLDE